MMIDEIGKRERNESIFLRTFCSSLGFFEKRRLAEIKNWWNENEKLFKKLTKRDSDQ